MSAPATSTTTTKEKALYAQFQLTAPTDGAYEVRLAYPATGNRATNVPVCIETPTQKSEHTINQRKPAPIDRQWISLGTYPLQKSETLTLTISNTNTNGHVIVDAVQMLKK